MRRIAMFVAGAIPLLWCANAFGQAQTTPTPYAETNCGTTPYTYTAGQPAPGTQTTTGNGCTFIAGGTVTPTNSAGAYSAATVGTTASTVVAAAACKVFCDVVNDSNTATICINVGAVATINAAQPYCPAGEITLGPFAHRSWEGSYVPSDAISAIASAASTAAAIGAK